MVRLPANIPFDQWLDYLFGAPVGPSGFRESDDWWDEHADPSLAVAYLTRLFSQAGDLTTRYSFDQLNQGLWFIASESGHLDPLFEPAVGWPDRRRALLAIGDLYARLFAPHCADYLGHLDRGPEPPTPLNAVCYMWWDLFPTWGNPGAQAPSATRATRGGGRQPAPRPPEPAGDLGAADLHTPDEVILHVLGRTLRLASEPCREGALHGLGHWHHAYPGQVEATIDRWLAGAPTISPELRAYAERARSGCVQ